MVTDVVKHLLARTIIPAAAALLCAAPSVTHAQQEPPAPEIEQPEPAPETDAPVEVEREDEERSSRRRDDDLPFRLRSHENENVLVQVGEDAHLRKGESVDALISVFGSATTEGEVHEDVVAVFGDVRATGPVGHSVVAVGGHAYIDERVGQDVVTLLGDLTLGPNAEIEGEAVVVGGRLIRAEGAEIHGGVKELGIGEGLSQTQWLRAWIEHCLLYGRPLAIEPGLGWAWAIAFAFLAFYVVLAMLFGDATTRCVRTLETRPGESVLAAVLSIILTPVLFILLLITGVGILLMPFLALALFAAGLFGKAVVFAWVGRRVAGLTGGGAFAQAAFPVLIGGLIVMGVYMIPVLGFIAYGVIGILGFGVVLYTFMLALQSKRATPAPAAPAMASAGPGAPPPAPPTSFAAGTETPPPSQTPGAAPQASAANAAPAAPAAVETTTTAPLAGFWIRMGALLIDVILVSIIVGILEAPGEIWLIALAGYGALMWKLKGTTVGGTVCHLQVVRVDGREIEWDTAIVRGLSCILSFAAAGFGFLWIAFDRDRQAWHDKIAGTLVVRTQGAPLTAVATAERPRG